jgi:uncharacterized membrane protein YoaK (UPF0700 family)
LRVETPSLTCEVQLAHAQPFFGDFKMATAIPPFDPRVPLLLLLSLTTGLVDAASVLGLGKVFTANMTGNVVFLGFAAAGVPGFEVMPFIVAIASFVVGAVIAGRIGKWYMGGSERRWLLTSAMFETILLWLAAGAALGFNVAAQAPEASLFAIIALTGTAMGFRNGTIRQLKVPDLTTTVLTLTLTGLSADSTAAGGGNPNWQRRAGAVAAIFAGAAAGAYLFLHVGLVAPLALAGALVLFGTLACASHPASTRIAGA